MQFKITKQLRAFFSVVALFAFSITFAQSPTVTISVPFSDGAIGTVGTNPQKNNGISTFDTLGIRNVYISQTVSSTSPIFVAQGNDIFVTITLVFENDKSVSFPGSIVWRTNNESFGLLADTAVSFNLNEYTTTNYSIVGGATNGTSSNFSLLRNDATWVYVDTNNISGNAAGVLDDLNAYLALSESSKPDGPITVTSLSTCDTTPIISGTVSMSMESGEYIVVTIDEVSYSYTNTNSNTSNITYDSGAKTWNLQIPSAIATGTYSVDASIYNAGGYQLLDATSSELEIIENILPTISNQSFSYDENRVSGAVVGTVTVTSGTSLTYSIISGDTTYYSIDSSTGAIALTSTGASSIANDFESTPNAFSVVVQVANTCNSTATATITLNVNDVDETETTPPTVNDQSFTYAENQSSGYAVGAVSATDNVGVSSYSIQSGNANGYFEIDSSTGAISLTATGTTNPVASNDFETGSNTFILVIEVADAASNTSTATITITVTDLDDTAPTFGSSSDNTFTYAENQSSGYAVGTVSATDNVGVSSYSIQSGNANGYFEIDSSTGAISLTVSGTTNPVASNDFETGSNNFTLVIEVTDAASNTTTGTVTINVTNIDEDRDGDGVLDSKELSDGTDPDDPCDFIISSQTVTPTSAWDLLDCDGDGDPNGTDPDPKDQCTYGDSQVVANASSTWKVADCDGDGDPNGMDPDPKDQCTYGDSQVVANASSAWKAADCDGDGDPNGTDPDPKDQCAYGDSQVVANASSAWKAADCDGDGDPNGTDPDPKDQCAYGDSQVVANASAAWKAADCDGDGDPNGTDTDPQDQCTYSSSQVASNASAEWKAADCDGDGDPNGTDPDPKDQCTYSSSQVASNASAAWKAADCDGDGDPNGTDTDPQDQCTYSSSQDASNASDAWKAADCDGDGDPNETDTNPGDGCDFSATQDVSNASDAWKALDCDGDGDPNGTDPKPFDGCVWGASQVAANATSDWGAKDCDNDGISNKDEINKSLTDPLDPDSDGDGVTDGFEYLNDGTNPSDPCSLVLNHQTMTPDSSWVNGDCDGDGSPNGEEKEKGTDLFDKDTDGDGVTDNQEKLDGTNPLDPCSLVVASQTLSPKSSWDNLDCDNDGLTNKDEKERGIDPFDPDVDGDGVLDGKEVEDGTNPSEPCDLKFTSVSVNPTQAWGDLDCDGDGLLNKDEPSGQTDVNDPDSDDDGVLDGTEVNDQTDPMDPCSYVASHQTLEPGDAWKNADCDSDLLSNQEEKNIGTNPKDPDTDKDGVLDGMEVNDDTNPLDSCSLIREHQSVIENIAIWNMMDCDGDSLENGGERYEDTDRDYLPNFLDPDDDGDNIQTIDEFPDPNNDASDSDALDANNNQVPDYLEANRRSVIKHGVLEVYNGLTPNGDGLHDVFTIRNIELYPDNNLKIYNRWGTQVYEADGYGINGKFFRGYKTGGGSLPSGVYYYLLKYNEDGVYRNKQGYLYLNR